METEAQDENGAVSNRKMAVRMPRGASVAAEKMLQVFNSGGVLDLVWKQSFE